LSQIKDVDSLFEYPGANDPGDFPIYIGGNLTVDVLLDAYRHGFFPWYNEGEVIQWWSPDPRLILFPHKAHVSHSMRNVFSRNIFRYTINQCFEIVIDRCANVRRAGQSGTWITSEIRWAYSQLHKKGYALSVETWNGDRLVGGLYGVRIGKVFFGESMFSQESNASKFALLSICRHWTQTGEIQLIDCQQVTNHLLSLGAEVVSRGGFLTYLKKLI
jgi:leucyl/phenylalanyl-tRNA--protein transferase